MASLKSEQQIYSFKIFVRVISARAKVHSPCAMFVAWKQNAHDTIVRTQKNVSPNKQGVMPFYQCLELTENLAFNRNTRKFAKKNAYIGLYVETGAQSGNFKKVGKMKIDVLELVTQNSFKEPRQYKLQNSSKKQAYITFSINVEKQRSLNVSFDKLEQSLQVEDILNAGKKVYENQTKLVQNGVGNVSQSPYKKTNSQTFLGIKSQKESFIEQTFRQQQQDSGLMNKITLNFSQKPKINLLEKTQNCTSIENNQSNLHAEIMELQKLLEEKDTLIAQKNQLNNRLSNQLEEEILKGEEVKRELNIFKEKDEQMRESLVLLEHESKKIYQLLQNYENTIFNQQNQLADREDQIEYWKQQYDQVKRILATHQQQINRLNIENKDLQKTKILPSSHQKQFFSKNTISANNASEQYQDQTPKWEGFRSGGNHSDHNNQLKLEQNKQLEFLLQKQIHETQIEKLKNVVRELSVQNQEIKGSLIEVQQANQQLYDIINKYHPHKTQQLNSHQILDLSKQIQQMLKDRTKNIKYEQTIKLLLLQNKLFQESSTASQEQKKSQYISQQIKKLSSEFQKIKNLILRSKIQFTEKKIFLQNFKPFEQKVRELTQLAEKLSDMNI